MKRWAVAALGVPLLSASQAGAQTSPSDFTAGTRYDAASRVVGTIAPDPDGGGSLHYAAVRNTYDIKGRLVTVEKGELATWQSEAVVPSSWSGFTPISKVEMSYDDFDRKILETNWGWDATASAWTQSAATQFSYDAAGRLECTAVRMNPAAWGALLPATACSLPINPNAGAYGPDRITKNVYDDAGQLKRVIKGYGLTTANGLPNQQQQDYVSYTYTPNGKQQTVADANGNLASYTYDGYDRLTKWSFPSKTAVGTASATDYEAYTYDDNDNRTSLQKRDGRTLIFSFDNLNRVTVKTVPDNGCPTSPPNPDICTNPPPSATRDVYYAYDMRGLQISARFDSASGADAVLTDYNGFGEMTTTTTAMGGVSRTIQHSYDVDGSRLTTVWPDALKVTYAYDGLDRLNWIYEGTSSPLVQYGFTPAQQLLFLNRASGINTTLTFDNKQRLSALVNDFNGTANDVTYLFPDYNPAGQIVVKKRDNSLYAFNAYTTVNRPYVTNGLNQYTNSGQTMLSYESNGNLRASDTTAYTYDVENRLIGLAVGGSTAATLVYDALGRLYEVQGAGTRRFLYDGDELVGEYDASGTMLARYIHGMGNDDPVVWYNGATMGATTLRFLHTDQQGSIVGVSDATGNSVATNRYDEYGIPSDGIPGAGKNLGTFQYTGQIYLPEIGAYYYKARIYSPTLGRFMQTDPIGYKDQYNLYAYVANDPINGTDPTGTELAMTGGCPAGSRCETNGADHDAVEMAVNIGVSSYLKAAAAGEGNNTFTDSESDRKVKPGLNPALARLLSNSVFKREISKEIFEAGFYRSPGSRKEYGFIGEYDREKGYVIGPRFVASDSYPSGLAMYPGSSPSRVSIFAFHVHPWSYPGGMSGMSGPDIRWVNQYHMPGITLSPDGWDYEFPRSGHWVW